MAAQDDDKICDVQFSLRVPKTMAEKISVHAAAEGLKPASWIRRAISKAIVDSDAHITAVSKSTILKLLETDKEVQGAVRKVCAGNSYETEKFREIESKFKRLRKNTENKLDELMSHRNHLEKKSAQLNEKIFSIKNDIYKLNSKETDPENKTLLNLKEKLTDSEKKLSNIENEINHLNEEIKNSKYELMALAAESEHSKIMKKWNCEIQHSKEAWLDDLEKLEMTDSLEDENL